MATKIIKLHNGSTTYIPVTDASAVQYNDDGTARSVQEAIENVEEKVTERLKIWWGTCDSAAKAYRKIIMMDDSTFPSNPTEWEIGTIIGVKYANTDAKSKSSAAVVLNINDSGVSNDKSIYYNTSVLSSTAAQTTALGTAGRYVFYIWDGTYWVFFSHGTDVNSTYSAMTQAEIDAGTSTSGRTMTPAILRSNFYTETEVNTLLSSSTADWNETDSSYLSYIKNKPNIIEPVQSDWNESNSSELSYIQNKPSLLAIMYDSANTALVITDEYTSDVENILAAI